MCFGQLLLSRRDSARSARTLAAGLAARAVVGLVVGVDDALHRRAAVGAGQAEAAVHRHRRMERRHLRRPVAGLARQPRRPLGERRLGRGEAAASIVAASSDRVSASGDRRARCRISSEYALPMPLKRRGSVSARFSVWFSATRRAANASRVAAITSIPPASSAASAARPATTCSEARRLLARLGEEQACRRRTRRRRARCGAVVLPGASQRRRPAIIRWTTTNSSPSKAKTMRLPRRSTPATRWPSTALIGGVTDAQQERMADADALEAVADDLGRQALEVDADVGQLGHRASVPSASSAHARRARPRGAAGRKHACAV